MMSSAFCLTLIVIISHMASLCHSNLQSQFSRSNLQSQFSHFEILAPRQITVRIKRDSQGQGLSKTLTLSIFGRKLSLTLNPGLPESLLSPRSHLFALHSNGTKSKIHLDTSDFHQGVIRGYAGSRVHCVFHDGIWMIHANHPTLSFSVEPLSFHTGVEEMPHMVAYRHRDVIVGHATATDGATDDTSLNRHSVHSKSESREERPSFSARYNAEHYKKNRNYQHGRLYKNVEKNRRDRRIFKKHVGEDIIHGYFKNSRKKRSVTSHSVCDLLAIADYSFFSGVGHSSINKAAKILLHVYQVVNDVFTATHFGSAVDIGVRIRGMEIYTYPGGNGPEQYFNGGKENVSGKDLVMGLASVPYVKQFCLVHLSTQRVWDNRVLGLATVAHTQHSYGFRGVCGGNLTDSLNIGASTVTDVNRVVPFSVYSMVVTHEIGHNFGALHDNKFPGKECQPKESAGGRYIMYAKTSNGHSPNNKLFSPCSRRSITALLEERPGCLIPKDVFERNLCGNGVIDYGEDCDAGAYVMNDPHGCCTSKCRFTPDAICSPFNHPCCHNCTVAPTSQMCLGDLEHVCLQETSCDGVNFHSCPPSGSMPNGHRCAQHGECQNGKCVPFCAGVGQRMKPPEWLVQCTCDEDKKAMCTMCCKDVKGNMPCRKFGQSYDDGTRCLNGICKGGYCEPKDDGLDLFGLERANRTDSASKFRNIAIILSCTLFVIWLILTAIIFVVRYCSCK